MEKQRVQTVFLAGGPRMSTIEEAIGMSVLGFPIRPNTGILNVWAEMLRRYDEVLNETSVVMSEPRQADLLFGLRETSEFRVFVDPRPHRGTGGVLADLFGPGKAASVGCEYLLIIERTACPLKNIDPLMDVLRGKPDIVIGISAHDRLAGVMAVRPEVLALVPEIGYSDLKEQVVTQAVSSGLRVEAAIITDEVARVDDLRGILHAVDYWHEDSEANTLRAPNAEIHGACSLHPSAKLDGATIIDSVCLEGAVVAPGAVVARSIVGRWASVAKNARIVDSIVTRSED